MSSFEFNFDFDKPSNGQNNLEEIMNKFDEGQADFQFDQFEDPVGEDPHQASLTSDFFGNPSKPAQQKRQSAKSKPKSQSREHQFQNSRNINEISIIENVNNGSFRFEKQAPTVSNPLDTNNKRYQNIKKLLSKAKGNGLDNFYRELNQQATYENEQKFRNKEEFKRYRNQLKAYKKSLEQEFQENNGNYNFKYNQYPTLQTKPTKDIAPRENLNFKKKEAFNDDDGFNFFAQDNKKGNMFSVAMQPDDFLDDRQLKPEEINRELRKYEQQRERQQGGQFFGEQKSKSKTQKEGRKLQTINQGRADLFEVTQQEQKMKKLLKNYQDLKYNYNHLMSNLKDTNTDQQKIIGELKKLKVQYENKESRLRLQEQSKKEKQILKQREKEEKFKKITEIKDQIHKIKQNTDKDLLINKLNQKVQSLQHILKNAIQELHQEKEPKLIPKIINYYNQPENRLDSQRSRASNEVNLSGQESRHSSQIGKLQEQYYGEGVRKAGQLKASRKQQPVNFIDQFSSPLQLDLTAQDPLSLSKGYSQQLEQPFVAPLNSKEYLPNGLDTNNKLLRRCLTQKSSILFESFEFYVTGKYTITGNDRYPVTCEVRVANKCAINLYDIFVIVYGPQAQSSQLQMRPPKIMYDQFKYNTSFLFQVDLSKSCIEVGNFSIQLSYKTDSVNKKKVNFKAVLPFAQLIKPEFIYEQQFTNAWNHMENEYYVRPKALDFKSIRSHEDLKLILPFMEINEPDPNSFSYGIMFSYPKSTAMFMLKVTCYVSGKASIHLKSNQANQNTEKKLRQQILDIMCYLVFG